MTRAATSSAGPDASVPLTQEILDIVARHRGRRGDLIAILQDVQTRCGYLPEEALRIVARDTGRSLVDVYGIATFYRSFALEPQGKHVICACLGTACHVRGSPRIVEEFQRQLGVKVGHTTADKQFTLQTVNCLGACALGPVVVIDGRYFSKVSRPMVRQLLDAAVAGFGQKDAREDWRAFPLDVSCPRCSHSLMDDDVLLDGHPSIRVSVSFNRQHAWLRLSAVYGSTAISAERDIPPETLMRFCCSHCHGQLLGASTCPDCGSPMAPMMIRGGGILQVCSRRECPGRALDLF